ncbi:stealth conserved region 3 domain-containing protein [Streptomyces sp. NPDC048172]|uniref:stealth conserved region 3 domain-containing protein n=1 Tax=Streptomyces sp. NPDC048172 TaxID=3365505 RepID=UPI00371CC8EE
MQEKLTKPLTVRTRTQGGSSEFLPLGYSYSYSYSTPTMLVLFVFVFVNALAFGSALVQARQLGIYGRALAAPVTTRALIAGESLAYAALTVLQSLLPQAHRAGAVRGGGWRQAAGCSAEAARARTPCTPSLGGGGDRQAFRHLEQSVRRVDRWTRGQRAQEALAHGAYGPRSCPPGPARGGAGRDTIRRGAGEERRVMAGTIERGRTPRSSRALRAYRRAAPGWARELVVVHTSAAVRARVKRVLGAHRPLGERCAPVRAALAVRRHPEVFRSPGWEPRLVRGAPRAVQRVARPTPLGARRTALTRVTRALEQAGVDHFCVRGRAAASSVVGVAAADRPRVLAALARACAEAPGYVSVEHPARPGRRVPRPGFSRGAWARHGLAAATVIRLSWYQGDPRGRLLLGPAYGCDVEFWASAEDTGELVAPRPNRTAVRVPRTAPPVSVSDSLFTGLATPGRPLPAVRTRPEFAAPAPGDVLFPVDAVYTWVDGSDPAWRERRARAGGGAYHEEAANPARYASHDELRYSLRSLRFYAPWIRDVYLVTDEQVPPWLDATAPGLRVVSHKEIFTDPDALPTFNSHAIESQLHHIEGLSEHFLYLNDDVFLGRLTTARDFFLGNGLTKFFPSPALVPPGPPTAEDTPVSAAAKNNRALVQAAFGTVLTQKMKHTPHAVRRSVLDEIEHRFPEAHRATANSRFRGLGDLSVVSSLHHYYAFHTARAVPGHLRYAYLDIADPRLNERLDRLLERRDRHAFCLNDTVSQECDEAAQRALLVPFLEAYFPVPGPYERGLPAP